MWMIDEKKWTLHEKFRRLIHVFPVFLPVEWSSNHVVKKNSLLSIEWYRKMFIKQAIIQLLICGDLFYIMQCCSRYGV